ncbi:MAG: hypothetical protein NZ789_02950, partial [Pseudomonadales bacterium]|nr:hypothetical protein [Pseudomonadales bacterium]
MKGHEVLIVVWQNLPFSVWSATIGGNIETSANPGEKAYFSVLVSGKGAIIHRCSWAPGTTSRVDVDLIDLWPNQPNLVALGQGVRGHKDMIRVSRQSI